MPSVVINQPAPGALVAGGQQINVGGRATGTGGLEPRMVASVTIGIDGGDGVAAKLTPVPRQPVPTALFAGSVTVPPTEGLHQILVTATDDVGGSAAATVVVSVHIASGFPRFTPTVGPIEDELAAVAANRDLCASIYLDTLESQGHTEWIPFGGDFEGEDHHQGLARTHQLSDGSIVFFLSHSETDEGDKGNLMHFRYAGPTEGEHVLTTEPLTVAPMTQLLEIEDQHPCDMSFLPEVGGIDAGYLFVAEQTTLRVRVYRWSPAGGLVVHGIVDLPHLTVGPNFVFLGAENDRYLLGVVASYPDGEIGAAHVFTADAAGLFPGAVPGKLDVSAFRPIDPANPAREFPFPVDAHSSQVHFVTDSTGRHFLLAYRASKDDDEYGDDFVDVHRINLFDPFMVFPAMLKQHIFLRPGKTSFASTGTHYVERDGRLLISSSYRWAEDERPDDFGYVSRVDECPS